MNTLVIYSSQTGFTERYAKWIAETLDADVLSIKEAKKKQDTFFSSFEAIIYGGWNMGGKLVNAEWFLEKAVKWKEKKLAMFGVGATPEDAPEIQTFLDTMIPVEEKPYVRAFYCPGGLDYSKMNFFCRLVMKTMAKSMNKQENLSSYEKEKVKALLTSFDASDKKFIEPIVDYMKD